MDINSISSNNRIINSYNKNKVNSYMKSEKIQINDRIEISKEGKEIQERSLDIKTDHSKDIERIKKAIKNGTYNVSSENLAKTIVEKMRGNNI